MFLRQSTSQVIRFGPCLDIGDAVTEETALTLAQADMRLSKDGGAYAQKSAAGNATHDSDGHYSTTLSTTDTNTVGELRLNVHQPANMLPVWDRWWVIEEDIYDALFGASAAAFNPAMRVDVAAWLGTAVTSGTGGPDVNVNAISDDTVAATNAEAFFDGSGYAGTGNTIPTVTTLTNLPSIPANWITAAGITAAALNGKGDWNIGKTGYSVSSLGAGTIDSAQIATGAFTANAYAANAFVAATFAASSLNGKGDWNIGKTGYGLSGTGIDEIWNEPMAGHTTADTAGLVMNEWQDGGRLDLILDARMAEASINTTGGAVDTVTTVTTTTNLTNLPSIPANWLTAAGINASALDGKGDWNIGKTGYSLTTADWATAANVNAEVLDVLNVDTFAEPGQGTPLATTTLQAKISYIYKFLINRKTATNSLISVYNDAATVVDQKSIISDNGTTYDEGEYLTGP